MANTESAAFEKRGEEKLVSVASAGCYMGGQNA